MQLHRSKILLAAIGLEVLLMAPALAATPANMMQECRVRAGKAFQTRLPNIDTKYEGQRANGTHAVNGTAIFRGRTETFQCSFNPPGRRIIKFVVNKPSGGASPQPSRPSSAAVLARVKADCIAAVAKQVGGKRTTIINVKRGETSFKASLRVRGAQAPWMCEHSSKAVTRVYYGAEG